MENYAKKVYVNGGRVYGMYHIFINKNKVDSVLRSLRFDENNVAYIVYKNKIFEVVE